MVRRRKNPPDGRVNNGGVRQGTPGKKYPNRSDLAAAPVTTVPGQTYGAGVAQQRAQQAVPMAGAPVAPPRAAPPRPAMTPDDVPNLADPTGRPDEPPTAGLPFGPGPGPVDAQDGVLGQLRALYLAWPTEDLREILEDMERDGKAGF
jgi:hypothetical protein